MPVPDATNLQALVLALLKAEGQPGCQLRREIGKHTQRSRTVTAFYMQMSKLENAGLVIGSYRKTAVDGKTCRERYYEITPKGVEALSEVSDFARLLEDLSLGARIQAASAGEV